MNASSSARLNALIEVIVNSLPIQAGTEWRRQVQKAIGNYALTNALAEQIYANCLKAFYAEKIRPAAIANIRVSENSVPFNACVFLDYQLNRGPGEYSKEHFCDQRVDSFWHGPPDIVAAMLIEDCENLARSDENQADRIFHINKEGSKELHLSSVTTKGLVFLLKAFHDMPEAWHESLEGFMPWAAEKLREIAQEEIQPLCNY